jgi:hypothetical protein
MFQHLSTFFSTAISMGKQHYRSLSQSSSTDIHSRRQSLSLKMNHHGGSNSAGGSGSAGSNGGGNWLPSPEEFDDYDDQDAESLREKPKSASSPHADGSWMSLPRKDQLLILFLARVVDFLQVASLQAFVFFQLRSLNSSLTDAEVSSQAGLLQGAFTGAQVLTAMLWGKAADASWCGRKMVLIIGLFGTSLSCLGYGFATSFGWAMFWRMLGGAINGTVGIM